MHWLSSVLLAIQVISSLSIIVLVLLQQGKGADMGSSFGSGSAGSVFGASGAANFLSRTTKWAAIIFFVSTGGLAYIAHHPASKAKVESGVMQGYEAPAVPSTGSEVPGGANPGASVPSAPAPQAAQPQSDAAPAEGASANPAGSVPDAASTSAPATAPSASASTDTAPANAAAADGAGSESDASGSEPKQ